MFKVDETGTVGAKKIYIYIYRAWW